MEQQDDVQAQAAQLRDMIEELGHIDQAQIEQDQGAGHYDEGRQLRIDALRDRLRTLESAQ